MFSVVASERKKWPLFCLRRDHANQSHKRIITREAGAYIYAVLMPRNCKFRLFHSLYGLITLVLLAFYHQRTNITVFGTHTRNKK